MAIANCGGADKPDVLNIRIDGLDQLEDLRATLLFTAEQMDGIVRRAINRAVIATRAEAVRILKEETTLTGEAASLFRKTSRTRYASGRTLLGSVEFFGGKGSPLHHYDVTPRQTTFKGVKPKERTPAEGLSFRYRKNDSFKARTGPKGEKSFWITAKKSGRRMVVYRPKFLKFELELWARRRGIYKQSKLQRKTMQERYKYKQQNRVGLVPLYAPSPIDVLFRNRNNERLEDYAGDMLHKRIDHEVSRELKRILA